MCLLAAHGTRAAWGRVGGREGPDVFVPHLGFTFTDVDDLEITLDTCDFVANPDCGQPTVPRGFAMGPIEFVAGPTSTPGTSWDRLKLVYR